MKRCGAMSCRLTPSWVNSARQADLDGLGSARSPRIRPPVRSADVRHHRRRQHLRHRIGIHIRSGRSFASRLPIRIVDELNVESTGSLEDFRYYLKRHIGLDADEHGPIGKPPSRFSLRLRRRSMASCGTNGGGLLAITTGLLGRHLRRNTISRSRRSEAHLSIDASERSELRSLAVAEQDEAVINRATLLIRTLDQAYPMPHV